MSCREKYKAIETLSHKYPAYKLCEISKVSKSGYYKWLKRCKFETSKDLENSMIKDLLMEAHNKYKGIYGRLRLCAYVNSKLKFPVNHKRIYRLMKVLKIKSVIRKKRYMRKFIPGKPAENTLNRNFAATNPLQKICIIMK